MDRSYEKDCGGATYRSRDPIKNFKIKISLKRLSASTLGFSSHLSAPDAENEQTDTALPSTNRYGQTILESEDISLRWQEKFFSQREMGFYGFEPNCTSVLDYKYHAEVEKLKKTGDRSNRRLFTYVDKDRFSATEDAFVPLTTSNREVLTDLNSRVTEVRRRKAANSSAVVPSWELNKGRTISGMKLVEQRPTDEFKLNHHVLSTPIHVFIVMADLSPDGQLGSAEYERRICTIEYDDNFVLRITPDFTRHKPPYRVDSGLSRDIWEFQIEHASNVVSKMESRRESKIISELYRKHQTYLQGLVGEEFEEIPKGIFRLLTYGEIVLAESFEYDDLHVEYFVDLPKNWSCDPGQLLSGCTHSCRTTLTDNIERAYFTQPFNYQMFLPLDFDDNDAVDWPKMFFNVISSDTWGRKRTEGYGYFTFPTTPGFHKIHVQCWRPTDNGGNPAVIAELKRFFIGGNPELEDLSYVAVPATFEGKRLSKFGVRTASTGSLTIHMNCMQQCKAFQESASAVVSRKKMQNMLQLAKSRASRDAMHGVIDAYQRARRRMQLARETVPNQIREAAQRSARQKAATEDKIKQILTKSEKVE